MKNKQVKWTPLQQLELNLLMAKLTITPKGLIDFFKAVDKMSDDTVTKKQIKKRMSK